MILQISVFSWQNMLFLAPCSIAALLLLFTVMRPGRARGGHQAHGGHSAGHHNHSASAVKLHSPSHGTTTRNRHQSAAKTVKHSASRQNTNTKNGGTITYNFILNITGLDKAPMLLLAEAFALFWGIAGFLSNQYLIHTAEPTPKDILRSIFAAGIVGLIGARITAEMINRLLPKDESLDQSRNSLFGLVGSVAFKVTETTGRIQIYDQYGTLHDESCRIREGQSSIEKGAQAIILDLDSDQKFLVEEVPGK